MNLRPSNHRNLFRIGAIVAATASTLIAWVTMVPVSGIELTVPAGAGVRIVDAVDVAFAAAASGVAAVGIATLIGRRARRPRRTWTIVATAVFVLSLLGPVSSGAPIGITFSLIALHSVVAVVLIPQLARTLPRRESPGRMEPASA